jgi:ABC-type branched-subunit amino acid transport system substrate-binding protein
VHIFSMCATSENQQATGCLQFIHSPITFKIMNAFILKIFGQFSDRPLHQNFRRKLPKFPWFLAPLYLLAACQPTPPSTSQSPTASPSPNAIATAPDVEGQLKIGTLLPLSGDLAQYGQPMQDTAGLLVETVNACGGAVGKPVKLVSTDDQTDPAAGAAGMTKLAEIDRVGAVVGAAGSAVSNAAVDIAVRAKVVQISPSSTSPGFSDRAKKGDFKGFWFRTAPADTLQSGALAQLAQQQGFKTVNILTINNDYGNGLAQAFTNSFEKLGIKLNTTPVKYAENATTFDSELSNAFQGSPDAVLIVAYPETGSLILKAAYEQGHLGGKTKLLLTDGMKTDNLGDLIGKAPDGKYIASGVMGTAPSAAGPALTSFTQMYEQRFNRKPSVFDPNTWDAMAVVVLAAEAAKATTGTEIQAKMKDVANAPGGKVTDVCQALKLVREGKDVDYQGASSGVDFDQQGDMMDSKYDVWTVGEDGKVKVLSTVNVGG